MLLETKVPTKNKCVRHLKKGDIVIYTNPQSKRQIAESVTQVDEESNGVVLSFAPSIDSLGRKVTEVATLLYDYNDQIEVPVNAGDVKLFTKKKSK